MTNDRGRAVSEALFPLADPTRAAVMRAYMRDQFTFLGIQAPARRVATRPIIRRGQTPESLLQTAAALWEQPEREYQYVAVDLLSHHWRILAPRHVDALIALARRASWWDTVDPLSSVIGKIVRAARREDPSAQGRMDVALGHPDFWVRRIAMLHQRGWKAETDVDRLFRYALELADEQEFFIRKAIGWALRDFAHHDPDAVRAFLADARHRLSALSVREAAKHLNLRRTVRTADPTPSRKS